MTCRTVAEEIHEDESGNGSRKQTELDFFSTPFSPSTEESYGTVGAHKSGRVKHAAYCTAARVETSRYLGAGTLSPSSVSACRADSIKI